MGAFLVAVGFALLLGMFAGSFWHVCIHRLPRAESIVQPGSRCYACGTPLSWHANLPVIGWLLGRGRCQACGSPIPARYLLVEILSGLLVAGVVVWGWWRWQQGATAFVASPIILLSWGESIALGLAVSVLVAWLGTMVVATVVDWMFLLIPDEIMLGWLLLAPLLGTLLGGPLLALHVGWLASPVESGWLQPVFGANTLTVHLPTVLVAMMWPVVALVFLTVLWWPGHRIFLAFVPGWQAADTSAMLRTQMLFSGGILATLLIAVAAASTGNPLAVGWAYAALQSAWGAILGWGLLAVISIGGTAMFKRYAMGLGDVKLLAPLGALVGPIGVVMVFALAVLLASCLGVVHLLRGGGREMPFGPSLAIAGMVVLLWGAEMLQLVLG